MSRLLTVSNEMLNISSKRLLGAEILAIVEKIQDDLKTVGTYSGADIEKLSAVITKRTGIKMKVNMLNEDVLNAYVCFHLWQGHGGVTYYGDISRTTEVSGNGFDFTKNTLTVDLDEGKLSGTVLESLAAEMFLYRGLFTNVINLSAEEITAIILHEIGHAFGTYASLGEYIYLNYMLTDGVEVLLGRKPNVYQIEILNRTYLEKVVKDPVVRDQIMKAPTEENLRRAILISHKDVPRHYLGSGSVKHSIKRNEQMADAFASRQGFSRALVTALDKIAKDISGSYTRGRFSFYMAELAKVVGWVATIITMAVPGGQFFAIGFFIMTLVLMNPDYGTYDNPTERLLKIRKDMIAQLKVLGKDPVVAKTLTADIEAVDVVMKKYNERRTLFEVVTQFLIHGVRRNAQLIKQEEQLEKLLNNDLFLHAHRISKLNTQGA